jgi:hypothetical protein
MSSFPKRNRPTLQHRPYYIVPEGKVGIDAFAVIRDAIEETGKVALGRVVLTSREHVIALEPRGKGLMGTLLRYPYEVPCVDGSGLARRIFTSQGLVGAAMCSACERGSHDRWP